MRRYRTQLAESIFDMLGDAIDDFEGPGDIGYEAAVLDVKAETDRRAEALERRRGVGGARRDWARWRMIF
jgi:3-deoxy-D-manno-octulosonate 8-phosphate phosphatase KdsC-like HAD superfamily phosphatase